MHGRQDRSPPDHGIVNDTPLSFTSYNYSPFSLPDEDLTYIQAWTTAHLSNNPEESSFSLHLLTSTLLYKSPNSTFKMVNRNIPIALTKRPNGLPPQRPHLRRYPPYYYRSGHGRQHVSV